MVVKKREFAEGRGVTLINYLKDIYMNYKKCVVIVGLMLALCGGGLASAAEQYECAMIKWDGPDKLAIIYPDRAETIRVFKVAQQPPSDVQPEEFCLTWGANKLAKEGWEPLNIDSRRILFRRPAKK